MLLLTVYYTICNANHDHYCVRQIFNGIHFSCTLAAHTHIRRANTTTQISCLQQSAFVCIFSVSWPKCFVYQKMYHFRCWGNAECERTSVRGVKNGRRFLAWEIHNYYYSFVFIAGVNQWQCFICANWKLMREWLRLMWRCLHCFVVWSNFSVSIFSGCCCCCCLMVRPATMWWNHKMWFLLDCIV